MYIALISNFQNLKLLIYNEFKDNFFSIIVQNQIIEEIKVATSKLIEKQLESAQQDSEKIVLRKLNNFENLYKVDF